MKTAFLSVDYNEGDQESFKGLNLTITSFCSKCSGKTRPSGVTISFNTGDPLVDWFDYYAWLYNKSQEIGVCHIMYSSSVDHWLMDGDKYYLKYMALDEEGQCKELHSWKEAMNKYLDPDKMPNCIVTDEIKTFDQLKEYYKANKKQDDNNT